MIRRMKYAILRRIDILTVMYSDNKKTPIVFGLTNIEIEHSDRIMLLQVFFIKFSSLPQCYVNKPRAKFSFVWISIMRCGS